MVKFIKMVSRPIKLVVDVFHKVAYMKRDSEYPSHSESLIGRSLFITVLRNSSPIIRSVKITILTAFDDC